MSTNVSGSTAAKPEDQAPGGMNIARRVKHAIQSCAHRFGYEIRRYWGDADLGRVASLMRHCEIDLVFDVGASHGDYARALRTCGYGGRIVAFEPLPDAHERLRRMAAADPLMSVAPRMALGGQPGSTVMNVARNSVSSSILPMGDLHVAVAPGSAYVAQEPTTIDTFDRAAATHLDAATRAYLKIDTQGYELEVLRGARDSLPRIAALQLELSLVQLYSGQPLYHEVVDHVRKAGFDLVAILPGFSDPATGRMFQVDGVFVRAQAWPGPVAAA